MKKRPPTYVRCRSCGETLGGPVRKWKPTPTTDDLLCGACYSDLILRINQGENVDREAKTQPPWPPALGS